MRARASVFAVCAAMVVAACEDVSVNPVINRIRTPIASPSFRDSIEPILSQTCASSTACHEGPSSIYGLDLTSGAAYASLFNVPAQAGAARTLSMKRVAPGDTANSFMFRVLSTDPAVRLGYYRMPLTQYPLPAPVVQTISNWIKNGAPNN